MILVDYFTAECCKGTELIEGWYWHEDDGENIGGPYANEEAAIEAAQEGNSWQEPAENVQGPAGK